jgi:hypothetical protein
VSATRASATRAIFRTFFSAEFIGKTIFQNFFLRKFQFFSHHFWGKIFREIFRGIFPGKNVRKIGPRGRCFDRNFLRFPPVFGKIIGVFTNDMVDFFSKFGFVLRQKRQFFR